MDRPLWEIEPDHVLSEAHGYVIEIKRHEVHKHLCGYIYIPDRDLALWCYDEGGVHGGWTLMREEDGCTVLGFDCAHAGDKCPGMKLSPGEVYRDIPFVLNELKRAARFLKENANDGQT